MAQKRPIFLIDIPPCLSYIKALDLLTAAIADEVKESLGVQIQTYIWAGGSAIREADLKALSTTHEVWDWGLLVSRKSAREVFTKAGCIVYSNDDGSSTVVGMEKKEVENLCAQHGFDYLIN